MDLSTLLWATPPRDPPNLNLTLTLSKAPRNVRAQAEGRGQFLCFPWATHGGRSYLRGTAQSSSFSSFCAVWDGTWLFIDRAQTLFSTLPHSVYSILLLTSDNDFKDGGKIHHLGEHLHDVWMLLGSADELLQRQLTWGHKFKMILK